VSPTFRSLRNRNYRIYYAGGVVSNVGTWMQRIAQDWLLILTQAFMGMVAIVLGVLDLTGVVEVWHVFVLAALLGLGTALDNPTRQSFVVEMVGPDDLPNAVGLNSASFNLGRVIGPALAGLLIEVFDTGPVFIINGVSFLAVIVALLCLRTDELDPAPRAGRSPGQVLEGIRYVRGRPDLVMVMALVFFVGTFGMNF
jgi:MFS family permease